MIDAKARGAAFQAFIRGGTMIGPHDCHTQRHEIISGTLYQDGYGNIRQGPPQLDVHYHICCPVMRYGRPQCP